jgi:hypothetical protein
MKQNDWGKSLCNDTRFHSPVSRQAGTGSRAWCLAGVIGRKSIRRPFRVDNLGGKAVMILVGVAHFQRAFSKLYREFT